MDNANMRVFLLLIVLVAVGILSCASGCQTGVKLAEIDVEDVPQVLRETRGSTDKYEVLDIKWRVSKRENWYHWVVYTCKLRAKDGSYMHDNYHVSAVEILKDGSFGRILTGTGSTLPPTHILFAGGHGVGTHTEKDGTITCILEANGVVRDPRVYKVVGITYEGEKVESTPVNGFWLLLWQTKERPTTWKSIYAVDRKGRTLHELKIKTGHGL